MSLFKEANGGLSWTRVRGAITLTCAMGLAFYLGWNGKLDQWAVVLILGLTTGEVTSKLLQKKHEK